MERQRLMVGYDLCADYSQISYYNTEKEEPDSVNFDGQNEIPTVLCRLFSNGEWLAGQQALKAAEAGNGVLVRDFIVRIADDPMVDVAGERMEKAGLIGIFFQKTLKALETVCEGAEVGFITITMEDVDLATADALKRAAASMGIGAQLLALESHRLSMNIMHCPSDGNFGPMMWACLNMIAEGCGIIICLYPGSIIRR